MGRQVENARKECWDPGESSQIPLIIFSQNQLWGRHRDHTEIKIRDLCECECPVDNRGFTVGEWGFAGTAAATGLPLKATSRTVEGRAEQILVLVNKPGPCRNGMSPSSQLLFPFHQSALSFFF